MYIVTREERAKHPICVIWFGRVTFFSSSKRFSFARQGKAGVAALLLLSFTLCFSGLPVYRMPEKDRSKPFPCQDNPCGCADAETCWRDCCCNTHAQKIAWAKEHGVTPPAYVFELAKAERAAAKSCCRTSAAASCCKSKGGGACCEKPAAKKKSSPGASKGGWVTWIGRQKCRGFSPNWLLLGHSIPLGAAVTAPAPEGLREVIYLPVASAPSVFDAPEAPPPRVSLA